MNEMLVEKLVSAVRERVKEGDNPTTPALSTELLEHLVVELARTMAVRKTTTDFGRDQ
jgi:hypothetical protein